MARCAAFTKANVQCQRRAVPPYTFCPIHRPRDTAIDAVLDADLDASLDYETDDDGWEKDRVIEERQVLKLDSGKRQRQELQALVVYDVTWLTQAEIDQWIKKGHGPLKILAKDGNKLLCEWKPEWLVITNVPRALVREYREAKNNPNHYFHDKCEVCKVVHTREDQQYRASAYATMFMMCSTCSYSVHSFCIGKSGVPDGDWFCDNCKPRQQPIPTDPNALLLQLVRLNLDTATAKLQQVAEVKELLQACESLMKPRPPVVIVPEVVVLPPPPALRYTSEQIAAALNDYPACKPDCNGKKEFQPVIAKSHRDPVCMRCAKGSEQQGLGLSAFSCTRTSRFCVLCGCGSTSSKQHVHPSLHALCPRSCVACIRAIQQGCFRAEWYARIRFLYPLHTVRVNVSASPQPPTIEVANVRHSIATALEVLVNDEKGAQVAAYSIHLPAVAARPNHVDIQVDHLPNDVGFAKAIVASRAVIVHSLENNVSVALPLCDVNKAMCRFEDYAVLK